MASFEVVEPRSLEEALALLDPADPAIRPLGGGTALMLMIKAQLYRPKRLVSLRRIGNLSGIAYEADRRLFRIGAMTTLSELEHSRDIATLLPVIPRTMKSLANVRVRNVATTGGNLAHADPHLDLPPVWVALGAEVEIAGPAGRRIIDVANLFAGYYETTLRNDEMVVGVSVPVRPGWRSSYTKVTTRAVHDWPALGLAVSAVFAGRVVKDVRIVLGACVDKPARLLAAESVLRGRELSEALLRRAGEAAVEDVQIASDSRGAADYKQHLLRVYLARAVEALAAG